MNIPTLAQIRAMEEKIAALGTPMQASIVGTLGITFLPAELEGADANLVVRATMPCDERTCQPFGYLSGGASLALAETLAGYGSMLLLAMGERPVGATMSANHVSALKRGRMAQGVATLLHLGRTTHVWNVDIVDAEDGRLVSTARVLNHILPGEEPKTFPVRAS